MKNNISPENKATYFMGVFNNDIVACMNFTYKLIIGSLNPSYADYYKKVYSILEQKNMAKSNLHTPDREQNEPEDKYTDCLCCNGTGKVIPENWDEEEDGEPTEKDKEKCMPCNGEGKVEIEDWENEW
jgi:hypothetical protein